MLLGSVDLSVLKADWETDGERTEGVYLALIILKLFTRSIYKSVKPTFKWVKFHNHLYRFTISIFQFLFSNNFIRIIRYTFKFKDKLPWAMNPRRHCPLLIFILTFALFNSSLSYFFNHDAVHYLLPTWQSIQIPTSRILLFILITKPSKNICYP